MDEIWFEDDPSSAVLLPLRWKYELIEGWYWRLRRCSAEVAMLLYGDNQVVAMVGVLLCDYQLVLRLR